MRKGQFTQGNKGKPKGAVSDKTKFWNELKGWMTTEGAEKLKEEMGKLKGQQFVYAYGNLLEYFQPKLSRAEVKHEGEIQNTTKVILPEE